MRSALIATLFLLFLQRSVFAAQIQWVGYQNGVMQFFPDNGSFFDGDNWLNYVVPSTNDTATFGLPHDNGNGNLGNAPHYVHFGNFNAFIPGGGPGQGDHFIPCGNAVISNLTLVSGSYTFDFASGSTGGDSFPSPTNGSLSAWTAQIGTNSNCAGASLAIRSGAFNVRKPGLDSLIINSLEGSFGCSPAELSVEGSNAAVAVHGSIRLAEAGFAGLLRITNGGRIEVASLYSTPGGKVVVSGANSFVDGLAPFNEGQFLILEGGRARTTNQLNLVFFGGLAAQATIAGSGSELDVPTDLTIGLSSAIPPILNIFSGGFLRTASSLFNRGTVTVSGSGSLWRNTNSLIADGYLRVENSSRLTTASLGSGYNNDGTIEVAHNAELTATSLFLGGYSNRVGTILIRSGGAVNTGSGYGGVGLSSCGIATVSGNNSVWNNTSSIWIGYSSEGNLVLTNGGKVITSRLYLGYSSSGLGNMTVTGPDSALTSSNGIVVGLAGSGILTVKDSGVATC